jgi:HNH endonuclease
MADLKIIVVFTAQSIEHIINVGGTRSWRLDQENARQCTFAVCTRNAHADWVEGPEAHHSAFLVGKIRDVVPSIDDTDPKSDGRFLIQFSEYARVDIPNAWKGDRNPVKYATPEELGIDPTTLTWELMPEPGELPESMAAAVSLKDKVAGPLTMAEAKTGLALNPAENLDAIDDIDPGTDTPGQVNTYGVTYARDPEIREAVMHRAEGKCEFCKELGFRRSDRTRYLECHHIIALARDGADRMTNVIALCPNHHREAHFGDRRAALEKVMIQKVKILEGQRKRGG